MPTLIIPGPFPVSLPIANMTDLPVVGAMTGNELMELEQAGVNTQSTAAGFANYVFDFLHGNFSSILAPSGNANTDTANLIAAINLAASSARIVPNASDPIGTAVIYCLPGTFTINQSNAMMSALTLSSKLRGLMIYGAGGSGQTTFVFTPPAPGPFMTNQRWQALIFVDIFFVCTVAGCDFMWSEELRGLTNIQANNYIRCGWNGWNNNFILTGGNNNSEWVWDTCVFTQTTSNVLYIPPNVTATISSGTPDIAVPNSPAVLFIGQSMSFTAALGNIAANTQYFVINATATSFQISTTANGAALIPTVSGTLTAVSATDQFLNFSFRDCKYNPGASNAPWVNVSKGGHIVFSGTTDISGWQPTVDTYLINTLGFSHARGVQNLLINKLRVEYLSSHGLLWHNQWPGSGANCTLNNIDETSTLQAANISHVLVELSNSSGPNIVYDNCSFQGQHTYSFGSNNFTTQNSIQYRACNFLHYPNAKAFIVSVGAVNSGGIAAPSFDIACRGTDPQEIFFTDLNWQSSSFGLTTSKWVNMVDANSKLPGGGANVQRKLPPNSVIQSVYLNKSASADTGPYSWTLQTTETTPTVLAVFSGANAGLAINQTVGASLTLDTDAKRTLQLIDTQNRTAVLGTFAAGYIG